MNAAGRTLVLAICAGLAVLLWEARREGPDFGHYYDWGNAALTENIFELSGGVLSRGGVPFNLAVALPGMLFATTYHAVNEQLQFRTAAYLTGWAAAMLFWVSAFAALRSVSRDNLALAGFGVGALFVGTHAGFYSFTYSSEVFASAFVAATWAIALRAGHRGALASAAVGTFAGLLLLVRPYLVLYALPPLGLVIVGAPGEWRRFDGRSLVRALVAAVPLALAVVELAVVNRWMTGSFFQPPYVYGGFGFQSVDLLHPQIGAVLTHPWRGLLVYHPLYGIAFVALLAGVWRGGPWRIVWAATAGVVLLHLWVQSAWHIWWLGGSFGMRGLAPAALPLVLALVAAIARHIDPPERAAVLWMRASLIACAWSFLFLLQADRDNPYLTWALLIADRTPAVIVTGALVTLWCVVAVCRARWQAPGARVELAFSAAVLVAASIGFLVWRTSGHVSPTVLLAAAGAAIVLFVLGFVSRWLQGWAVRIACVSAVVLFAAQMLNFAGLAARTERYLASGEPPPRQFRSVGAVPIDDLRQNYVEYTNIPGFADRKRKLRAYLNWLEIDGAKMPPADRDLSERVLRAITADPVASRMFVRVIASDGTLQLTSTDLTEETRRRVVEVARAVPGVTAVEADMK